jgi:hypothetical protein
MEFYSAMKSGLLSFTSKWMELENIILSEVSQVQKTKNHYVLSHMWTLDRGKHSNVVGLGSHDKGEHIREVWG